MSEQKLPRLLAAAKEFNIGRDTLIDFLVKKGFAKDELKDTAKLTEGMYHSLQAEFSNDKAAKNKADLVEIPKAGSGEPRKKKDEEDISISKKEVAKTVKVVPVVTPTPVVDVAPIVEPIVPEVVIEIEQPKPVVVEVKVEPIATKEIVTTEMPIVLDEKQQPETLKIEAPELEGPRITGKIDLSAIDSSTKPKKGVKKKKEEETAAQPKEIVASVPVVEEVEKVAEQVVVIKPQPPKSVEEIFKMPVVAEENPVVEEQTETAAGVIENIEVEKLTGPKILGKIELPKDNDTRPKPATKDDLAKRKRIPIDKKGSNIQHVDFRKDDRGGQQGGNNAGGGFNRGGGQQGGRPGGGQNRPGGGQPNRPGGARTGVRIEIRKDDREIDKNEIQAKIKETQAKLAGNSGRGGRNLKAKNRRDKRREAAENEGNERDDNKLQVTEFVTVSELANLMDVGFTDIISKCMNLGIMVSINQRLDAEVIELVASEFNFEVEFTSVDDIEEEYEEDEDNPDELVSRPPIVTIMGHVDHGKTSLLDYIRSANVVAGESGGITQHIGAYEVTLPSNGKNITFLDTPGHEAFTAMRARGAKVTDIAVIVVAADDAVMPQTKEAISHAQAASVPMIFAVNKMDRDGANPQKIYEQLSQMNILVESWGGKFQSQELSAKKGLNVDLLLEKILLEAELLELKANPKREGSGTIIEASLDKGKGYVATILVQGGTLNQGDLIVSGQFYGRVKAMFNERNQRVKSAPPSTPVVILGLNGAPQAGEKFKVYTDEAAAKEIATKRAQISREQGLRARKHITLDEIGRRLALGNFKELNIIIKGDVDGSVEALSDSLQKLSTPEVAIKVVLKAVGQISESDVLLAAASDAILIGFNVRPSSQANKLAENEGVQIKQYSIIYKAIEEIKAAMEGMLEPKVEEREVATVEIREVFKFDKATVAGSYVTEGKIKRDHKIKVFRDGILIYPRQEGGYAELASLKRFKDDVKEVNNNYECGLTIKGFTDIQPGDTVVAYEEEEIKRSL
ncbi:MAG: translation initiation factor IF-2 [Chitinophagaceae bacterium]